MNYKGIIIAAGYGTRFLPATKTLPKEMLPVINIPSIDFIVKEFLEAGIKDILIITHRKKKSLEDYYDRDPELEAFFTAENKPENLEKIKPVDANIAFIRQQQMKGTGQAVLLAEPFVGNSPFIIAYPDDIVLTAKSLSTQMIDIHKKYNKAVLATMETEEDVSRYGVVDPEKKLDDRTYLLRGMVEKPKKGTEPSRSISIGRYLFESDIFARLKDRQKKHAKGEFFLTDGIEELIKERKVVSYNFEGQRLDTGKPEGYLEAVLEYSVTVPELKEVILNFVKKRNLK